MNNPMSADALYADVIRYAAMGEHRTASQTDLATSNWIRDELAAAGMTAELDPWQLRQFQLKDARVKVFGQDYDAFPLWHPTASGPEPLRAPIAHAEDPAGVSGSIALVQFPDLMVTPKSGHAALIEQLADAGAKAIIGCTPHESGCIYGQNVIPPYNQQPWPIPMLMIAPSDWHVFDRAASIKAPIDFKLVGFDDPNAVAHNVVARLERGKRWIVVSTPQSGWFRSAGERGAGVALLLGLGRWAAQAGLDHSLLFLSNSGHEIGHMGAFHTFRNSRIPQPELCDCWLHLGSCIATNKFRKRDHLLVPDGPSQTSWLFSSPGMIELLQQSFCELPHLTPEIYNRNHGEIRWILERGFEGFSLMGPQQFFHLRGDGPEVVDAEMLERVGMALRTTLEQVSRNAANAEKAMAH